MNVAATLKFSLRRFFFHLAQVAFILVIGMLAGCFGADPKPFRPPSPEALSELKQSIARIRGLEFKRAFTLSDKTNELPFFEFDEYGAQPAAQLARAYKSIGLLPESTDFTRSLGEFARLQNLIAYDFQRDTLALAPQAALLGHALAKDMGGRAEQVPGALALTYALQEQNFRWQERLQSITIEDRKLAFRAVAAGDALIVAETHLHGNPPGNSPQDWQGMDRLAGEVERLGAGLPPLLRDKLVFPYRDGSRFVKWALDSRGWPGVNALFADPPLSTAQILHPEKYYRQRETPLRILPQGLIRQMRDSSVLDQTLGEYLIQGLLAGRYPRAQAIQIASGWRGDYLSAYDEGNNLITAWYSAWRTDESAETFMGAFRNVLERRHRIAFTGAGDIPNRWQAKLPNGQLALLQRKGPCVVFLNGIAPDRVSVLGDETWNDLEIAPENMNFPFESARGPAQLSLKRR